MSLLRIFLPFLILIHSFVHAGNRFWEPSRRLSNLVHANWFHFDPTMGFMVPWPDKMIPICYEDANSERYLGPYVTAAMELWYAAGLPRAYRVEIAPPHYCEYNRPTTLRVTHTPGRLATSIGMNVPGPGSPGPQSDLDLLPAMGLQEHIGNIAHELGHAWGLYHEHQNKAFWAADGQQRVFVFQCENMQGFAAATRGLTRDEIWGARGVCVDWMTAVHAGVPSTEFLPLPWGHSIWASYARDEDVDWDSIMLYSSKIGANAEDAYVLMRRHGQQVLEDNVVPSAQDVQGIRHLYENRLSYPRTMLLNDPRNPYYSNFKRFAPGCT